MPRTSSDDATPLPPAEIEQYLAGLEYPASKAEVLEYASDGRAPQEVMDALALITEKTYGGPAELEKEIGGEGLT